MASTATSRDVGVSEETIMITELSEPPGNDRAGGALVGSVDSRPNIVRRETASW
jgi:hypothetical protein